MTEPTILITHSDVTKLDKLLKTRRRSSGRDLEHLERLRAELERAELVEDTEIPADVITINSRVLVQDLETGQNSIYILVFPNEADQSLNKVSVLAPIGTALLGYRAGDIIEWDTPDGTTRRLFVREVLYQPEAARESVLRAASSPSTLTGERVLRTAS